MSTSCGPKLGTHAGYGNNAIYTQQTRQLLLIGGASQINQGNGKFYIDMYDNWVVRFGLSVNLTSSQKSFQSGASMDYGLYIGDGVTGFSLKMHVANLTNASTIVTLAYSTEDGIMQTLSNPINILTDTAYVPCTLKLNGGVITFSYNSVVVLRGPIAMNVDSAYFQSYVEFYGIWNAGQNNVPTPSTYQALSVRQMDIKNIYVIGAPTYLNSDMMVAGFSTLSDTSCTSLITPPSGSVTTGTVSCNQLVVPPNSIPYNVLAGVPNIPTNLNQLQGTIPYSSITRPPIVFNNTGIASLIPNTSIGIGTTSPQQLCHVSNGNLLVDNAGVSTLSMNGSNMTATDAFWKFASFQTGVNNGTLLDIAGNFGRVDNACTINFNMLGVVNPAQPIQCFSTVITGPNNSSAKIFVETVGNSKPADPVANPYTTNVYLFLSSYSAFTYTMRYTGNFTAFSTVPTWTPVTKSSPMFAYPFSTIVHDTSLNASSYTSQSQGITIPTLNSTNLNVSGNLNAQAIVATGAVTSNQLNAGTGGIVSKGQISTSGACTSTSMSAGTGSISTLTTANLSVNGYNPLSSTWGVSTLCTPSANVSGQLNVFSITCLSDVAVGQLFSNYVKCTGNISVYNQNIPFIQQGIATVTLTSNFNGTGYSGANIQFPSVFNRTPSVVITNGDIRSQFGSTFAVQQSAAAYFSFYVSNGGTSTVTVNWVAIGY